MHLDETTRFKEIGRINVIHSSLEMYIDARLVGLQLNVPESEGRIRNCRVI
jgi:hypothetical protein